MRMLAIVVATVMWCDAAQQSAKPADDSTPTFRVDAPTVVLDVTVLDKNRQVVTKGLDRDDFRVTERHKQQRIVSFQEPTAHSQDETSAPPTIFVLDMLNTSFENFAFIRFQAKKFLNEQPGKLRSPVELLVLNDHGLATAHDFTTRRDDLLQALAHIPAGLPFKLTMRSFYGERFVSSIDSLRQIAVQNRGVAGRKNIIWIGSGGPGADTSALSEKTRKTLELFIHQTANMLVRARCSLFLIYPGVSPVPPTIDVLDMFGTSSSQADPFAANINFASFVEQTGGKLFFENNLATEMKDARHFGSEYYTIAYHPDELIPDSKFVHIRVELDKTGLRAITKSGYYAPDSPDGESEQKRDATAELADALSSKLEAQHVPVSIENVQHDAKAALLSFIVVIQPGNLSWHQNDIGRSVVELRVAAAALDQTGRC